MHKPRTQTPHVAIVPSPGIGHVIPLVELAKRLVGNHGFTVTFVVPTDGPPSKSMTSVLDGLPEAIDHVFLPPVNFDDLPEASKIETRITLTVARSLPAIRQALQSLVSRQSVSLVALVADIFATDAIDVARGLNLSSYVFFPSAAMPLSLAFHLPYLDETTPYTREFWELPEPVRIPGCIPVPGKELPDPLQDRKNDAYKWTLQTMKRYRLADGIMVNSFSDLEPGTISSLQERGVGKPAVYAVGPLVKMGLTVMIEEVGSNCLTWLDRQPRGSVLFVSFGSGGTLSSNQINELALGLEKSGQRFLWVVRRPNDKASNATYFGGGGQNQNDSSFDFLPGGFLDRTKDRSLVVDSWAPQAQILSHCSTGGFLSHCGWNSVLESVVNGVPLIAWPLYAEQKMNAFMLSQDVKVAMRPRADENGVVGREEVARVVKALMEGGEGKRLKKRMEEMKEAGSRALSEDGASTKALADVADQWTSQITDLNPEYYPKVTKEMEIQAESLREPIFKGEIPEKDIQNDKDIEGEPLDATFPAMDIPVIDLGLLGTSSSTSAHELVKLKSGLSSWGCFQAINHGMTPEFLDAVRDVTKQFFELPMEKKKKYSQDANDIQGYRNDLVLSEQQKGKWGERLYLVIRPEDQRKLKLWPEKPEVFRSILHEYSAKLHLITEVVLKAMARSLNLEERCFLDQYGERAKVTAKFSLYPPCPRPDLFLGQKPHADGSAITLILQDKSTEGLQFLNENQWFRAPIIPEALLVNIGDQAEISSNGIFKSSIHRVVTNSQRERISLVVFYIPEIDKDIEPFEKLINESRPRLYKKIKNYPAIYFQYHQQGKRPIEAAKM